MNTNVFRLSADHTAGLLTLLRNTLGIPKVKEPPRPPHVPDPETPMVEDPPIASASTVQAVIPSRVPFDDRVDPPRIEVFGPRGLRRFLRLQMLLTHTHSQERYAVHELLTADEAPSCPGDIPTYSDRGTTEEDRLLENESPGRDIRCDSQGYWRGIVVKTIGTYGRGGESPSDECKGIGRIVVDAGPIDHRDPCIGYVIREIPHLPQLPALRQSIPVPRKLVILGDTFNPDALVPLIDPPSVRDDAAPSRKTGPMEVYMDIDVSSGDASVGIEDAAVTPDARDLIANTPVSLLIHEATDAYIPRDIDPQERTGRNRTVSLTCGISVSSVHYCMSCHRAILSLKRHVPEVTAHLGWLESSRTRSRQRDLSSTTSVPGQWLPDSGSDATNERLAPVTDSPHHERPRLIHGRGSNSRAYVRSRTRHARHGSLRRRSHRLT